MGQHDATRKAGGSRRVLHVDDIPRVQLGLTGRVFRIIHHDGERENFGHGIHAPVLFSPQKTYALEVRQAFAHQPVARLQAQLWRNAVQGVEVIVVAHAVDEKNIFTLGVREQIAQFVLAVVGVYRNEHSADFCGGKLQGHPVRHVGRPHGHLFALLHAKRHEPLGEIVHQSAKFAPGLAIVAVRVNQCLIVRVTRHSVVEHLPQCPFAQFKLRLTLANFFFHASSQRRAAAVAPLVACFAV